MKKKVSMGYLKVGKDVLEDGLAGRSAAFLESDDSLGDHLQVRRMSGRSSSFGGLLDFWSSSGLSGRCGLLDRSGPFGCGRLGGLLGLGSGGGGGLLGNGFNDFGFFGHLGFKRGERESF